MTFKIGDTVQWTSSNTAKTGEITHVVPAGKTPRDVGIHNAGGGGMSRKVDSYIVRGAPDYAPKRKGNYWPVNSTLRPAVLRSE